MVGASIRLLGRNICAIEASRKFAMLGPSSKILPENSRDPRNFNRTYLLTQRSYGGTNHMEKYLFDVKFVKMMIT